MSEWIDITRPMDDTLVMWPGRAHPARRWQKRIADGAHCNASFWELSAHSGTHMDAPLHFIEGGRSIDQISPDVFIGPCILHEAGPAGLDEEAARRLAGVKRLLVKTNHSVLRSDGRYEPHEALMAEAGASILLEAGLVLIGTDRLSVDDSQGRGHSLHRALLGAGCVIVEGLSLSHVLPGEYQLQAAPLRMTGTEASPVRALLFGRGK